MTICYCFRPQRYKILKPIHNNFQTLFFSFLLFQTTKIQNFETNSQPIFWPGYSLTDCFRPQRYKILKPIHNQVQLNTFVDQTVSDHKDTKFWNQFTTKKLTFVVVDYCFRPQRYKILKPIHNKVFKNALTASTVSDHKDTKFWNQFTTKGCVVPFVKNCFRPQRYKILKPIHNQFPTKKKQAWLFQTTKIQNFETNSQPLSTTPIYLYTVSDHKDTKFWNQFTTYRKVQASEYALFQTTKIQKNQLKVESWKLKVACGFGFTLRTLKTLKTFNWA